MDHAGPRLRTPVVRAGVPTKPPMEDRARGLMVGLLLGDAIEQGSPPTDGWLRGSCLGQLACFTLEGLIRAHVRGALKGICSPPGVVWNAYLRWATVQGIALPPGPPFVQDRAPWLDGWLYQVAPLAVRRGSAPATVAALSAVRMGDTHQPVGTSAGHHALNRTLPVALFGSTLGDLGGVARDLAALTHGAPGAWDAAVSGTEIVARALGASSLSECLPSRAPASGPIGTAAAALAYGCQVARDVNRGERLVDVLASARGVPGAATFLGAILGAHRGRSALPEDLVQRLEIGWVADKLACDAVLEQVASPGGAEFVPASDPGWWRLYPGW